MTKISEDLSIRQSSRHMCCGVHVKNCFYLIFSVQQNNNFYFPPFTMHFDPVFLWNLSLLNPRKWNQIVDTKSIIYSSSPTISNCSRSFLFFFSQKLLHKICLVQAFCSDLMSSITVLADIILTVQGLFSLAVSSDGHHHDIYEQGNTFWMCFW